MRRHEFVEDVLRRADRAVEMGMRDDAGSQIRSDTPICPYLGTKVPNGTRLCRARRDDPIQIGSRYIEEYCLTAEHTRCSLFLRADAEPMTAEPERGIQREEHRGGAEAGAGGEPPGTPVQATQPPPEQASTGSELEPTVPPSTRWNANAARVEIENVPITAPREESPESARPDRAVQDRVVPDRAADAEQGPDTSVSRPEEPVAAVPVPVITSPEGGATVPATDLVVSGTGGAGLTIHLLHWGVGAAVSPVDADGAWSITLRELDRGDHILAAKAVDGDGRSSNLTPLLRLTVVSSQPAEQSGGDPDESVSPAEFLAHRAWFQQIVHEFRERRIGASDLLRRVFTVLVCVLAVAAVVVVALVIRSEISWSQQSAAGPASHPAPVGVRHRRNLPLTAVQRSMSRTVTRRGSAHVLAAEASRAGNQKSGRSPAAPRPQGYSAAHFPALSAQAGTVILTVSNRTPSTLDVAVRFPIRPEPLHIDVPAHSSGELNLSAETPRQAGGAVSLSAAGPFLAQRWVLGGTHTVIAGAIPEFASAPQLPPAVLSLATSLDAVFKRAQIVNQFSGAALVSLRGQIVFQRGYGVARGNAPIQPSTAIPIRRLTTMFTSVAIMQLQDRHRLSVTDRMCRYLPGCPRSLQSVTIAQLLTNTSGIRAPRLDVTKPFGEARMMAAFGSTKLLFTPGTRWKQSDTGFVLLGFIIEKVSGLPYQRFIRDRILAPLGMKTSGFVFDARHPALAQGFHGTAPATSPARPSYVPVWGMYSTVTDLERFDRALDHHTILSPAAISAMFGRHVTFIKGGGFAYGWVTDTFHGQPFASVNAGNSPGYVGINLRLLGQPTEIIILSNQDRTSLLSLVTSVGSQLAKKR